MAQDGASNILSKQSKVTCIRVQKPVVTMGEASSDVLIWPQSSCTTPATSTTQGCGMTRRGLVSVYGRFGLIIAAFVFIAGIIAAPVLPKSGAPAVIATKPRYKPDLHLPITPVSFKRD